jgi:hypothetical protein
VWSGANVWGRVRKSRPKEAAGAADAVLMQIEWSEGEVLKSAGVGTEAEMEVVEGVGRGIDGGKRSDRGVKSGSCQEQGGRERSAANRAESASRSDCRHRRIDALFCTTVPPDMWTFGRERLGDRKPDPCRQPVPSAILPVSFRSTSFSSRTPVPSCRHIVVCPVSGRRCRSCVVSHLIHFRSSTKIE